MFLSIKEMEVRKVRFDETFPPGEIDFSMPASNRLVRCTSRVWRNCWPTRTERFASRATSPWRWKRNVTAAWRGRSFRSMPPFDLFYRPMAEIAVEEEVAIDEGEAEMGFYEGDGLELEDILREQILLLLPMQRVCRADCKGICPVCGRNRNEASCECRTRSPATTAGARSRRFVDR